MTEYQLVYDRFEGMITDYDLQDLMPASKAEVLLRLLKKAIVDYFACPVDLSDRDDTLLIFNNTLTETQEQVLANYMVYGWIEPYLMNQDLFETNFATNEYKVFSPSARMKELRENALHALKDAGVLSTKESLRNVLGVLK